MQRIYKVLLACLTPMALKAYLGATLPAGFDMGLAIDLESYSGEFKPTVILSTKPGEI